MIVKTVASNLHPAIVKEFQNAAIRAGVRPERRVSQTQWRMVADQIILALRRKMMTTGIVSPVPLLLGWSAQAGALLVVEGCVCEYDDAKKDYGFTHVEQVWPLGPCEGLAEKLWPDEDEEMATVPTPGDFNVN